MSIGVRHLRNRVSSSLTKQVVKSYLSHVQKNQPKLWGCGGKDHEPRLVRHAALLAVYKDMNGLSYNELTRLVPSTINWSRNVLHHNQRVLRHTMKDWSDTILIKKNIDKI